MQVKTDGVLPLVSLKLSGGGRVGPKVPVGKDGGDGAILLCFRVECQGACGRGVRGGALGE